MSAQVQRFDVTGDDDKPPAFQVGQEFINSYGDERRVIKTPAPWDVDDDLTAPNDVIKSLDWDEAHYSFEDRVRERTTEGHRIEEENVWVLDTSSVSDLREAATGAGYRWDAARTGAEVPEAFLEAVEAAEEGVMGDDYEYEGGDTITVRYEKKNGNGQNEYSGQVERSNVAYMNRGVGSPEGHRVKTGATSIAFTDENGKAKWVKPDEDGTPSLYCSGHHPFMGEVVSITLE